MKKGRHPKNYVEETQLRDELAKMHKALTESEKARRIVERDKKRIINELWTARRVIGFWAKEKLIDFKKNGILRRLIKNIFSNVPKKPVGKEKSANTVG